MFQILYVCSRTSKSFTTKHKCIQASTFHVQPNTLYVQPNTVCVQSNALFWNQCCTCLSSRFIEQPITLASRQSISLFFKILKQTTMRFNQMCQHQPLIWANRASNHTNKQSNWATPPTSGTCKPTNWINRNDFSEPLNYMPDGHGQC